MFLTKGVYEIATKNMTNKEDQESNAEMLIAIPDRAPSRYLVPPPFPPPLSILIKRKTPIRRYYQEPRSFEYNRNQINRLPVNSIQDILSQMERESSDYEKITINKPKRINFYGSYRHRPNRPKVIPIQYNHKEKPQSVRDTRPLVPTNSYHIGQGHPYQYYQSPIANNRPPVEPENLYDTIIATNKQRQESNKESKPFSLMLDIYPVNEDNKTRIITTMSPPLTPPQLPPLQIDHAYYNSIKFPQINPTIVADQQVFPSSPNEEPGKMVVHLNLYPTKKRTRPTSTIIPGHNMVFFNDRGSNEFLPIANPQGYYQTGHTTQGVKGTVIDIPRQSIQTRAPARELSFKSLNFGQPIHIDYRTTIAPQTINQFFYDDGVTRHTYQGHFNSNEMGRRNDVVENVEPKVEIQTPPPQRNSHQPDNPMVLENLSLLGRFTNTVKPARLAISS